MVVIFLDYIYLLKKKYKRKIVKFYGLDIKNFSSLNNK